MLRLGNVTLDAPFFQAGLAGYSDAAMRLVARRHGAPFAVTEAMLDQFLINGGRGLAAAELDDHDHPIAGQLMGSHPDEIAAGARILVKLGYDVIDVNLACPVKKIRKKARGGHLMQAPDDAIAILDAVRQAVGDDRPCTVKLRRGTDDTPQAEANFHRIFEKVLAFDYAGAVVHGRTVEQKYLGPSQWSFLSDLTGRYGLEGPLDGPREKGQGPREKHEGGTREGTKPRREEVEAVDSGLTTQDSGPPASALYPLPSVLSPLPHPPRPPFVLGGSGDIWCAADIFRMIRQTGVQLVSVARGCIGNPWIFRQARAIMAGDLDAARRPPTVGQQRQVLLDHFQLSVDLHGEGRAGVMMRKFGIKFSRHHPQGPEIARAFIAVKSLADWQRVLDEHYADADQPGVAIDMQRDPVEGSCDAALVAACETE